MDRWQAGKIDGIGDGMAWAALVGAVSIPSGGECEMTVLKKRKAFAGAGLRGGGRDWGVDGIGAGGLTVSGVADIPESQGWRGFPVGVTVC